LGIEVANQKQSLLLSQRKYALNLLKEVKLLGCKPTNTPMKAIVDLWFDDSHTLDDPRRYRRLIEKLIYLTITRPDITFAVGVLSRFMHQRRETHRCDKGYGLHQELSRKRVGVKEICACTHFWILRFRICW